MSSDSPKRDSCRKTGQFSDIFVMEEARKKFDSRSSITGEIVHSYSIDEFYPLEEPQNASIESYQFFEMDGDEPSPPPRPLKKKSTRSIRFRTISRPDSLMEGEEEGDEEKTSEAGSSFTSAGRTEKSTEPVAATATHARQNRKNRFSLPPLLRHRLSRLFQFA